MPLLACASLHQVHLKRCGQQMGVAAKPMAARGGAAWLSPAPGRSRCVWCALALLVVSFGLLATLRGGSRAVRHALRVLYYSTDPLFLGR
jgi:hypothetical protein